MWTDGPVIVSCGVTVPTTGVQGASSARGATGEATTSTHSGVPAGVPCWQGTLCFH